MGKPACNSCDNMFNRRTDSRVHAYKFHEHGNDDEAEVKPNSRSIKKANKNISSTWISGRDESDQYDPNLTKDESNIWKGRRPKLFQTSLTQIPMPVDNQNKRKKWLMSIGLKYQDYGVSDNDVWTINSYYRISDERGDRKRRKLLGYTHFQFLYIHICRGKLELQKRKVS